MTAKWRQTMDDFHLWLKLTGFEEEVLFKGVSGRRKWRWDFALPDRKVAVEYHGKGVGHHSIKGAWDDQEKSSEGTVCGWKLITCNAGSVEDGRCIRWIERLLEEHAQ